ncbi:Ser-Thr-rich glycosyl-phosphatidyl-inositol-anchored membrane family-domain-containing protein [Pilaira anomala]|nr:Ser-Thr-rich glycosyl-phosphatidyl-inositol-anchored membrane family-domain-containing protein [Pilaira anomala]
MKSFFLALFALTLTMVYGQANPVYITSPLTGATYTTGSTVIIRWMNPVADTITQIILAKGISTNIQPVQTIATNVPTSAGQYSWTIPSDLPAGNDYAFALGTSPDISYTGQFTINAGAAPTTTTTNSSSDASMSAGSVSETESVSGNSTSATVSGASASGSGLPSALSSIMSVASSVAAAPSSVVAAAPSSISKAASSAVAPSRSASATLPSSSTSAFGSGASYTKASFCAIVMTAFAMVALF